MSNYDEVKELRYVVYKYKKENVPINQEIKRFYWNEHKKVEKQTRCIINGKPCGLRNKCSECPSLHDEAMRSLEFITQTEQLSIATLSAEDEIIKAERHEILVKAISELDEIDQKIIKLLYFHKGWNERKIALEVGVCQKTVNNRKTAALAKLRSALEDYRDTVF